MDAKTRTPIPGRLTHAELRWATDKVSALVSAGIDYCSALDYTKVPEADREDVEARVRRIHREGRPRDYLTPTEKMLLRESL